MVYLLLVVKGYIPSVKRTEKRMRKKTRLQYVKGFKYSHQNNLRKKNPKELFLTQFDLSLNRKMYVRMKKTKNTGMGKNLIHFWWTILMWNKNWSVQFWWTFVITSQNSISIHYHRNWSTCWVWEKMVKWDIWMITILWSTSFLVDFHINWKFWT